MKCEMVDRNLIFKRQKKGKKEKLKWDVEW